MTEKVEKIIKEINEGKRSHIFGIKITLEEYLSKIDNETTLLEFLLKNNIFIYETNVFENSLEAAKIYLKLNKSLWKFKLSEEQLFQEIDGKKVIEILIEKGDSLNDHIKCIKNNLEIIDILIANNKYFALSYLSEEITEKLMNINESNEYNIEKYFNDENAIEYIIPLIDKPNEIINLCIKHNKEHLLTKANENVLMHKLDNNKTLLEELISKKQIPTKIKKIPSNLDFVKFLTEKNCYEYLKKAEEKVLLLEIEPNKTLLEILIEKHEIEYINIEIESSKTIDILNENHKLHLIKKTSNTTLLSPANELIKNKNINKDITFLEYMLENGYNPIENEEYIYDKKIIEIICEKGYTHILNEKRLSEEQLMIQLSNGETVLDKILNNNVSISFGYSGLKSVDIAKKIFEKERFDLLVQSDVELLLTNVDSNNNYLDYILESIKTKKIKYNLNNIIKYNTDVNNVAKLYITIAKHGMIEYVNDLTENKLLKEYNGKTLLDELLDLDSELTTNVILSNYVKANMKIAIILKSRNLSQKNVDIPLEKSHFAEEYLNKIENEHGIGPMLGEGDSLLIKLYELFSNDGKSDPTIISALISGYRQALITNYELTIKELRNLIGVKENNFDKFIYCKDESRGAYFSPAYGHVSCSSPVITTVLHETGHALHHYLSDSIVPENYQEIITRIRENKETIKKVEEYADKYRILINKMTELSDKQYGQFIETYFTDNKKQEILEFIKKTENEKKEDFKELGLSDEVLNVILSNIFTTDEYINQQKRIYINEYSEAMVRSEFGGLMAIGDILDAIYEGELYSGVLENENGAKIKRTSGHGIAYYSETTHGFDEMLANYALITKENDAKEIMDLLRSIVGDELCNMLDEFYRNNIIKETELEKGKSL